MLLWATAVSAVNPVASIGVVAVEGWDHIRGHFAQISHSVFNFIFSETDRYGRILNFENFLQQESNSQTKSTKWWASCRTVYEAKMFCI